MEVDLGVLWFYVCFDVLDICSWKVILELFEGKESILLVMEGDIKYLDYEVNRKVEIISID